MCKSKSDCGCGCKEVYVFEDASKEKDTKYQKFFRKALKKFKVKDPNDFKSDEKKKEFYNWVDDNYKAKNEAYEAAIRNLIRRELSLMKEDVHLITESKNRQSVMKWVKGIFKSKVRNTEEFGDGWNGGIWVCGECGDTYTSGKRIYNYYGNSRGYNLGVLQEFESKLNKMGWYSEWYDTGTVFIFPIAK